MKRLSENFSICLSRFEKNHRFWQANGKKLPRKRIRRERFDRLAGETFDRRLLVKNSPEVKYGLNFAPQACNV
jgi:hypothetical protein